MSERNRRCCRYLIAAGLVVLCSVFNGCEDPVEPRPWPTELPANREDGSHLNLESDPFYEGWYHNVVIPDRDEAFFFIYGVTNPRPDSSFPSEAFVYCGRQSTLETVYQAYPVEQYRSAQDHRDVQIGERARATALRIAGDIDDGELSCSWDIDLAGGVAWTETMGGMTAMEGLETNWTVGTIHSEATGSITFGQETIAVEGALGYADHNWGTFFPREWIWLQTSTFDEGRAAIAASGGTVPMGDLEIEAMMIGLLLDEEMITFRTQDLDRITWEAERGTWSIEGERSRERISIQGTCESDRMFHLLAPTPDGMQPRAWETLLGTLEVIYERRDTTDDAWQSVYQATASQAALEIGD